MTNLFNARSQWLTTACLLAFTWIAGDVFPQTQTRSAKARATRSSSSKDTQSKSNGSQSTTTTSNNAKPTAFAIGGLTSPATVSNSLFVTSTGLTTKASVTYFVDEKSVGRSSESPYWLGNVSNGLPVGFDVSTLSLGTHTLHAEATFADATSVRSNDVVLNVIPSTNGQFSSQVSSYPNHFRTEQTDLTTIVARSNTAGASLSATERQLRQSIAAMYQNWGIDISLDSGSDQSSVLASEMPTNGSPSAATHDMAPVSMWFSADAPFYHAIPAQWPRVALPSGYFRTIQFNSAYQGDGIGFGQAFAKPTDPMLTVVSQWYNDTSTRKTFPYHIPLDWPNRLPTQSAGDSHVIFVDPDSDTFVSTYKTKKDPATGGPDSLFASSPTVFGGLGTSGGSIAAGFAELPAMIQPGEATDPNHEIGHAIGGPVSRTWAARVFPASSRDAGVLTSVNSCTNSGFTNTGLIPYGGVIQLDPSLNLQSLSLSLPARRVLRAMQVYGYYVMDFGCSDFDIYTAIDANELEPFGGPWGNANGKGVQNEIQGVLTSNLLYVVAPLMKKQ